MIKRSKSNQFLVRSYNPQRATLLRGLLLIVVLILCWASFEYGRVRGGYDNTESEQKIDSLDDQVSMLNARIDELMLENAHLVSDSAIDATANEQVSIKLRKLNAEMLELKEELVFYRSLLSPSELEPGLQILGVQMIKNTRNNTYNYKIVLTQRRNRNQYATGKVDLTLLGSQAGQKTELLAKDVINGGQSLLSFRFKNFQSLEGELSFPEGFQPQNILVNVVPRSSRLKAFERNYAWNSIITGG